MSHPLSHRGFSLIELMIVVGIIVALAGISYPVITRILDGGKETSSRALVDAVMVTISSTQARTISGPDGKVRRLWDFNNDELLDGDPAIDSAFSASDRLAAAAANYGGFVKSSGREWDTRILDKSAMRVVDSWRQPLRIRFSSTDYGSSWFGIWSVGEDGQSGTADDICSWKSSQ